jgi:predicted Zn-dependent peptidase
MRAGSFVLAFALLASATNVLPSRAANGALAQGALAHGGAYLVERDPGVAQAAVELWFRAPSNGYDASTPGIAQLAAVAVAAVPLAAGRSLVDFLQAVGGRFSVNVYPDMVAVSATVPASAARRTIATMTAAYFAPTVSDESLKSAQQDAAVLGIERKYSATLAIHDLVFQQLFAGGPAHQSPLPESDAQITAVSSGAVDAFAKRAFRASNALLAVAGNVDLSAIDAVTDGTGGTMDPPYDSRLASSPQDISQNGSVDGIGLAWAGPPIVDEKAATAMDFINDYLFRDDSGTLQRTLDAAGSSTALSGQFVTLHDPGVMVVTISGPNADAARTSVLAAIASLDRPMDAPTFAAAQQAFVYHCLSDAQTPQAAADNLGWYGTQGNAAYAPGIPDGTYVRDALALDSDYVAGIVRRYLKTPVVVRLVTATAKGSAS